MKKLIVLSVMLLWPWKPAQAEDLQWNLPWGIGTVQLPTEGKDIIPTVGRDFVLNDNIGGVSASLLTLYKEVNGYAGVVGAWDSKDAAVEPYLALGADVIKYVPMFNQFKSLQLHGFGRYSTTHGGSFKEHLGAGIALAYSFK